jgi:hypothetical protein
MNWKIYYDNGSTFDNEQGDPEDAPGLGILCIVQKSPHYGKTIVSGWDFYYYRHSTDPKWWGCDQFGLFDQLISNPRLTQAVKAGRMVETVLYHTIREKALNDPDFPPMSGQGQADIKPKANSQGD